jgi:hypothetical protein
VAFSSALLRFTEQEPEDFVPQAERTSSTPPTAQHRRRTLVRIGTRVIAGLVLTLTLRLGWPATSESGLHVTTLSPARVAVLGLSVEVQLQAVRQSAASRRLRQREPGVGDR